MYYTLLILTKERELIFVTEFLKTQMLSLWLSYSIADGFCFQVNPYVPPPHPRPFSFLPLHPKGKVSFCWELRDLWTIQLERMVQLSKGLPVKVHNLSTVGLHHPILATKKLRALSLPKLAFPRKATWTNREEKATIFSMSIFFFFLIRLHILPQLSPEWKCRYLWPDGRKISLLQSFNTNPGANKF